MGYGVRIRCKCRSSDLMLGCGFSYPMVYQEIMDAMKKGEYGDEIKDLVNNTEFVAVNAENEAYYCDKCGKATARKSLDLYKPKDVEKVKKEVVGRWTVADEYIDKTMGELGELPYWNPSEMEDEDNNWVLLKEYLHVCPECGNVMKKIDPEELVGKTCPKCGEKFNDGLIFDEYLWD